MTAPYVKYLQDLIGFKSITPFSNGALEYINQLLLKNGFNSEIKILGEDKVANLYAVYGISKPNICFAGHADVVPPGDIKAWKYDPFTATIENGKIYGRGAVDMKGALACSLAATLSFVKEHRQIKGSISFLITSDEEGEAKSGIKQMLPYIYSQGHSIDLAIVGEPTSNEQVGDRIKIGRRGSINFTLTVDGKQGHVAYPEQAINPIPSLVKIINHLITTSLDSGNQFFAASNLEITSIDVGNNVSNLIPSSASCKFNIRFNDFHTPQSLVLLVEKTVKSYTNFYKLNYTVAADVFLQKTTSIIVSFADIVQQVTTLSPEFSTTGGTSDARFLKDYCQTVELGLLAETAHKINEYTKISDLQKLYDVYYGTLCKFLVI